MTLPTAVDALAELERQKQLASGEINYFQLANAFEELTAIYAGTLREIANDTLTRNKMIQMANVALERGKPYREAVRRLKAGAP